MCKDLKKYIYSTYTKLYFHTGSDKLISWGKLFMLTFLPVE